MPISRPDSPVETKEHLPRRLPVGAEPVRDGVHFRLWAPNCEVVEVALSDHKEENFFELPAEGNGYFSGFVKGAGPGSLYKFRLDKASLYPDPASRFQPHGPYGPSEVIDPERFEWTDSGWRGIRLKGQVLYEMHVGTFSTEGIWEGAVHELKELAGCGITIIELMPVADFSGMFGWGYDGVDLFAPTRLYGRPDDFRNFVDSAHLAGIGVILDVVYNHVGPESFLHFFSADYFTDRYKTDWGKAINYDGENCGPVREFVVSNAVYWIREFHLDGLRLDATQNIYDSSPKNIIAEVAGAAKKAAGGRSVIVITENEPQYAFFAKPADKDGMGIDGLWNDDFHHTAEVALTGHNEAYYTDYKGAPQEFISVAKYGYLYQGQWYSWQGKRRGTPTYGLAPEIFINYIQNHDQIANSAKGFRVDRLTSPGLLRTITALLLLMPGTPMLFQGQEFAASSPFMYFADLDKKIMGSVRRGRSEFLKQFRSLAIQEAQYMLPDPSNPAVFLSCKLDFSERVKNAHLYQFHKDLLRIRREEPAFSSQKTGGLDGAVLLEDAFVLRYFDVKGDRLLLINMGKDLLLAPSPEPLLAPPDWSGWQTIWASEHIKYGGGGAPPLEDDENWRIPGQSAFVLAPKGYNKRY